MTDLDLRPYIATPADFWHNVQEPSSRVKDKRLLAQLCVLTLKQCDDRHIRAAAAVNLLYRSTEPEWESAVSSAELQETAEQAHRALAPESSFDDCRWFLSSCLAQAAAHLFAGDRSAAFASLAKAAEARDVAYSFGQLYTNIVKCLLLQLAICSSEHSATASEWETPSAIDHVLERSNRIAQHYKFDNQWAYEEVAYVYTMLREIYNWRRLRGSGISTLADLEQAGFRWRCIEAPFKDLIDR